MAASRAAPYVGAATAADQAKKVPTEYTHRASVSTVSEPTTSMSRRTLLKQGAVAGLATVAAPMLNLGRYQLFGQNTPEYSARAIALVQRGQRAVRAAVPCRAATRCCARLTALVAATADL